MNQPTPLPPSLNLGDIYYILFRHKWKIIVCAVLGIMAALAYRQLNRPLHLSEAKLLVRYIVSESKTTGPNAAASATAKIMTDERGATIMSTEVEILTSMDLATEVATAIGPEKILAKAGGGKDLAKAIALIRKDLRVTVPRGSNVIQISFRHPDPDLVQPFLRETLNRYMQRHVAAHRSAGLLGDSLAQEADTLRSRLRQTEEDLRKESAKLGVISIEKAKESYDAQLADLRREILTHEADLAGRMAVFEELKKRLPAQVVRTEAPATPEAPLSSEVLDRSQSLSVRIARLQQMDQELALQFTSENTRLKQVRAQLAEAEASLKTLREQHPSLARVSAPTAAKVASGAPTTDPAIAEASNTWIQITSTQARIKELTAQYEKLRTEASKIEQMEGTILELRRKRELEEANYRYYSANVEQARINEALGNGKVSNINEIQTPTPAFPETANVKTPALYAAAGLIAGLAWAFLIELFLDRSVRRPADLAGNPRAPLFLSIPQLKPSHALPSPANSDAVDISDPSSSTALVLNSRPSSSGAGVLIPYHDTLRDRLIAYFESKNLTHKPKLVAVTGLQADAGVTTTAAGLARSLSETGDGNVLLVDMTASQGATQQFLKGKAVCGLDDILEARSQARVQENLYVVSEMDNSDRLSRNLPKRFSHLIPQLKASDFDYIIFDMPSVSQLSITPRLASFMDMVLLVVESEKTDRNLVQGACSLLSESKTHVGVVLNKTRNYVPTRLQQELLAT